MELTKELIKKNKLLIYYYDHSSLKHPTKEQICWLYVQENPSKIKDTVIHIRATFYHNHQP